MAEFIEILSPSALKDLETANAQILILIKNIDSAGIAMKNIKTPSGGDSAIKGLNDNIIKQEKQIQKTQLALEKARLQEIKIEQAREKAIDKYNNNLEKQEELISRQTAKQISESQKIIAQKEKEFKEFEKQFNKYEADLAKQAISQERANQKAIQDSEKTRLSEIKLQQQREKAFDKYEASLSKEQAKLKASETLYNRISASMRLMEQTYKDLALRKELGGNLTKNEESNYIRLQKRIQEYDRALKAVDATMGKHQRNVGNYAGTFNPLSNSINQLTREMPAFTYSVQTGFMALSNNIPIFTDAIGNAIKQNKLLQAEGKPTTSVLSQLAGAFLSWQTVMGIGITLLTVYGKEIGEFIGNAFKAKGGVDALKEAQKQLNEASVQGRKNAVEETINLKSLLAIAKDTSLSYKERMIAVNELQSTYPAYLGNLSKEKILAGETAIAEKELTEAILSRARANAAIEKITENQAKIIDIETKRLDLRTKLSIVEKQIADTQKEVDANVGNQRALGLMQKQNSYGIQRINIISEINELSGEKSDLDKINNTLTTYAIEKEKESILLKYKDEKATKDGTKAKRENLEAIDLTINKTKGLIDRLEDNKKSMQDLQRLQSKSSKEWAFYQERIDLAQKAIDYLTKGNNDLAESAKKATDQFEKLHVSEQPAQELEKISSYLQGFIDDFASNSGLTATFQLMQGNIEGFGEDFETTFVAIAESAQEAYALISQASQENFALQYSLLEKEKSVALQFAGESVSGQEEIQKQYEEKKRQIANREAQAKKKQAIFNIAIDKAQAIVASLKTDPTGLLAIGIGLLGLAQIGIVQSQEVPQFFKGTDNAPEGMAWTQEKGREIITDKSGKIKSTGSDKGAQLTYLSKGDKVFTAEKSAMMFNESLNSILTNNGISGAKIEVNNSGVSDEQINRIVSSINNKESVQIYNDGTNIITKRKKANQLIEIANRRINFVSKSV